MSDSYDVIVIGSGAGGGTAMANAIRVGDHLLERMGVEQSQVEPAHVA